MDRIAAIRKSLAVFEWGIFGLLPVLGLLSAIRALIHGWAVRSAYGDQWNPASAYLKAGIAFSVFGLLNTLLIGLVIAAAIVDSLL